MKVRDMKTMLVPKRFGNLAMLGLLSLVIAGCASAGAKSSVRVTEEKRYIQLNHVQDGSRISVLRKEDAQAMLCKKCKTVQYPSSTSSSYFYTAPLRRGIVGDVGWRDGWGSYDRAWRHYCPGCKSTITTAGRSTAKTKTIEHTCTAGGDESAFCCATGPQKSPTAGVN